MSLFENAPVTFMMSIATLAATSAIGGSESVSLDVDALIRGQAGRLLFSQFTFAYSAEVVVALILFYSCRMFERQMGSRKYAVFLLFTWVISLIVQLLIGFMTRSIGYTLVPTPGPYFFVFAQLAFFYRYIPKLYMTQYVLFGLEFSEKSGIYLLALQLFFSDGIRSAIAAFSGILAGYLYYKNVFLVQRYRLPKVFENVFKFVSAITSSLLPEQRPRGGRNQTQAGQQPRARQPTPNMNNTGNNDFDIHDFETLGRHFGRAANMQLPPPDEESIQTLMALGFDRDAVVNALRQSGNNVDAAANVLLR